MFDLKNLNPGAKFYWDESTDEWVVFRVMADADLRRLKNKCAKERVEYRRVGKGPVQRFEYLEIDEDAMSEEINDFCIVDWHLLDTDGNEIPCTRENKCLLMDYDPKFSTWAAECLEKIREDEEKKRREEEKN